MKMKPKWGGKDDRFGGSKKGPKFKTSAVSKGKQSGGAPFKEGKVADKTAWSKKDEAKYKKMKGKMGMM